MKTQPQDTDRKAMRRRNRVAGTTIAVVGLYVIVESLNYRLGSLLRMGPGFLPLGLGGLLVLFGAMVAFVDDGADQSPAALAWRPAVLVLGGLLGFALLIEPAGLAAATAALVFVSGRADPSHSWGSLTGLYVILLASVYVVFALLMGIPFKLITGVI